MKNLVLFLVVLFNVIMLISSLRDNDDARLNHVNRQFIPDPQSDKSIKDQIKDYVDAQIHAQINQLPGNSVGSAAYHPNQPQQRQLDGIPNYMKQQERQLHGNSNYMQQQERQLHGNPNYMQQQERQLHGNPNYIPQQHRQLHGKPNYIPQHRQLHDNMHRANQEIIPPGNTDK